MSKTKALIGIGALPIVHLGGSFVGRRLFDRKVDKEVEALFEKAERYGEFNGETRLETWAIPLKSYREFEGVRVPTEGEVTWTLDAGDFNWFNFKVTEIEYDNPHPYQ